MSSSCTSCLSTQWPCSWCIQLHSCVSNQSQCQDSPNPTVSISLVSAIPAPAPTPLVPTSLVFKFAPTARGGVGQGTHHCMFSNSLWLDRLVAFPLPCLRSSLQESRFFEATLQGYSVTFWKARARLKPGPPSTVDAKGGTLSPHVSSFSDTSSLCPCGFERRWLVQGHLPRRQ